MESVIFQRKKPSPENREQKSILKRSAPFPENVEKRASKRIEFRSNTSFVKIETEGGSDSDVPTDTEDNLTVLLVASNPVEITFHKTHIPLNGSDSDSSANISDVEDEDGFAKLDQFIPGYGKMLKENLAYIVSMKKGKKEISQGKKTKRKEKLNEELGKARTVSELLDRTIDNAYYIFETDGASDELWEDLMKVKSGERTDEIFHSCIKEAYLNIDKQSSLKDTMDERFSTEQDPGTLLTEAQKHPGTLLLLPPPVLKDLMKPLITNAYSLECLMRLTVKHAYAFYLARDGEFSANDNYRNVYLKPLSALKRKLSSLKRSVARNDPEEKQTQKIEKIKASLEKVTLELGIQQQCREICKKYITPLPPAQHPDAELVPQS